MKKIISTLLCLSMLFSLSVTSFAAEITTSGGSKETTVAYGMDESFLVTIPGDFAIGNNGKAEAVVAASNVMIGHNKTLEISISGDDYVDSWELIDETESTNRLTYIIGSSSGASDIVNNSLVLIVAAGEACDTTVSEKIYFTVVDDLIKAGTYNDTLTFTVEINGNVLEGNGQTFHRMAPSALSFRSQEPLSEFQKVLVNGVEVSSSNYTLTEGSTIVTLDIDYLNSLENGVNSISIVSDNNVVEGTFSIVKPRVNNYNFYYNQPYTGYVEMLDEKCAFFMHDNGEMELLCVGPISTDVTPATYEVKDNKLLISSGIGNFTGVISDDASSIYCEELDVNFVIGDKTIVADEEYIYTLHEYNSGYRASVIDKTKSSYGTVLMGVNGIPTTHMESTYRDCVNLVVPPVIPYGIENMDTAFGGCVSLKVAPVIPESVIGMIAAFADCTSLEKAPTIPAGVVDLSSTFIRCYSLKGEIKINTNNINIENANSYGGCFKDTIKEIVITGSASDEIKATLAGTAETGNVTYR